MEYQAVVLAGGRGTRMTELTSSKAKCLLPIGGYPMIWYSLNMLKRIGFKEIIVITLEHAKSEVCAIPKKYDMDVVLDVVTIPAHSTSGSISSHGEEFGTADAIRHVHDKLKAKRIMIVSSDLVTDVQLRHLTDLHSVHNSSITALLAHSTLDPKLVEVPGPKSKPKKERDIIGIDHKNNNQVCYFKSEADLDSGVLSFNRKILYEHPKITMYNDLLDAHFYIFDKWVCDFLNTDGRISTIKGELIPYLVKKQFSINSNQIGKSVSNEVDDTPNPRLHLQNREATSKGVANFVTEDPMISQAQDFSSWNDHSGALKPAYMNRPLRCYAYVMDKGQGICLRANNLHSYMELNRKVDRILPSVAPNVEYKLVHPTSNINVKSQIGDECLVGEDTIISEKTTIKNCSIGSNCIVEPKVRLTNCILMDKVIVKSGSNVHGSLVCDNVTIEEKCDVKECIVGSGVQVENEGQHFNELLASSDSDVMEI